MDLPELFLSGQANVNESGRHVLVVFSILLWYLAVLLPLTAKTSFNKQLPSTVLISRTGSLFYDGIHLFITV